MRIYSNWKWAIGTYMGQQIYEITDPSGNDWYTLMEELDDRPEKWAIGICPNGWVMWVTDEGVSGKYAPVDGGTVILTDSFEFGDIDWRGCQWDGNKFHMPVVEATRTKEDIESDLRKLLVELESIK